MNEENGEAFMDFKEGDYLQYLTSGIIGRVERVSSDGTLEVFFEDKDTLFLKFTYVSHPPVKINPSKDIIAKFDKLTEAIVKEKEEIKKEHGRIEKQSKFDEANYFHEYGIDSLWHITHKDNISQILKHGILNHYDAHQLKTNCVDISDPDAQRWREHIDPHYKRRIHAYAPLYIKPQNPMLYVRRDLQSDLCLLEVSLSVMFENEYLITDGNAASRATKFFNSVAKLDCLPWDVLNGKFWPDHEDGKRKMCAEVLIHPAVAPSYVEAIHCYSIDTKKSVATFDCPVRLSRNLFF